jgi:hypothetical protein
MTRQDLLLCSDRLCDNNTPHYHTHCHSVSPPLEQETLQTSEATPEAGQENGIPGSQNSDNSMNPINLETKPSKTVAMSSDETTRREKKLQRLWLNCFHRWHRTFPPECGSEGVSVGTPQAAVRVGKKEDETKTEEELKSSAEQYRQRRRDEAKKTSK